MQISLFSVDWDWCRHVAVNIPSFIIKLKVDIKKKNHQLLPCKGPQTMRQHITASNIPQDVCGCSPYLRVRLNDFPGNNTISPSLFHDLSISIKMLVPMYQQNHKIQQSKNDSFLQQCSICSHSSALLAYLSGNIGWCHSQDHAQLLTYISGATFLLWLSITTSTCQFYH